jgi:hypothetical protein
LAACRRGFVPLPEKPDTARTFTSTDALGTVPNPAPPEAVVAAGFDFLFLLGLTAESALVDCCFVAFGRDNDNDGKESGGIHAKEDMCLQFITTRVTKPRKRNMLQLIFVGNKKQITNN